MTHRRNLAALVLAALMALAACSGPIDENIPTLHRSLPAEPESLDPHKARSIQAADVLRDIGEGLVGYSPDGELVPAAAERWQISDDGREYTFYLREDARWSNGDPVLAEHFVFSLRRLVAPQTAAFYATMLADLVNAADIVAGEQPTEALGVEAIDERTLLLRLDRPTPYILSLLTHPSTFPVHPPSVRQHGDAFARPGKLLSNGAYILRSWVPGSTLKIRRNESYWNDVKTAIDAVTYHVIVQPAAELNRYRAGELHITSTVPTDSFQAVRENYADELKVWPTLGVYYYGFNLSKPPFDSSPALRQALSMAIDRDLLADKVVARGEAPAYSWVPPGVANYNPPVMSFADLTQSERNAIARGLYAETGYGPDNPLTLALRYNTSDTNKRIAVAIQSMWRDVLGVETTLINEEFQVLIANVRARQITEVFRSSWLGDYNDAHTFLGVMLSNASANTPGYASGEFDSLMQRAAEQTDRGRRRLYLEEAERVLLADHAVIPLYFYVSKHLVSPQVGGWGDNVLDYHYSQHLSLIATE
ncbi:MAG: peptide ABC transporter substrate-binding protein [Gammaproteobacteria bacterium]|nr:peptide ABC transporter substrate-binding protein [Gammaproteobacteria bacterium]